MGAAAGGDGGGGGYKWSIWWSGTVTSKEWEPADGSLTTPHQTEHGIVAILYVDCSGMTCEVCWWSTEQSADLGGGQLHLSGMFHVNLVSQVIALSLRGH